MRGKAQGVAVCETLGEDHPRVCGEKTSHSINRYRSSGSPPRMRGKAFCKNRLGLQDGITPAYAGKRRAGRTFENCNRDHPRVCGEKHRRHRATNRPMGSPPRMRGKECYACIGADGTRITPAYAGKSLILNRQGRMPRDHPRVCGEKCCIQSLESRCIGSPPRMRGKVVSSQVYSSRIGITPAYAGKSHRSYRSGSTGRDHPRVCGEKKKTLRKIRCQRGSPPRMRGKGCRRCRLRLSGRITPAYAGKRRRPLG